MQNFEPIRSDSQGQRRASARAPLQVPA